MTYVTGSIVSSATPATALITQIEATLSTHAAWEFIEAYASPANGLVYHVWKNKGTLNGFGQDWFLILDRAANGTGNVTMSAAEGYDAVNHRTTNPCPYHAQATSSTLVTPDSNNAFPGSPFVLTGVASTDGLFSVSLGTSATAFDYFYTVSNATFTITTKVVSVNTAGHVGLFDSLLTGGAPDPFPLVLFNFGTTQSATVSAGAFSRMPRQQLSLANQFCVQDHATTQATWWNQPVAVTQVGGAAAVATDQYQQDRPVACRVLLSPRQGLIAPADVGFARGLMRNVIVLNMTGVLVGDTVTIGADTYVYVGLRFHWMNVSAP